jgi:MoaA/NifB/PqqE/SkfB family radical SAM enzyme
VRAKAILRFEDYKKVLDELGPTLLHIDFMNWGEPLLHREIFDMVAYAKRFDVDTHISTNLNEFDAAMAEKMVLSGLDAVTLSIDGMTQETYSKYRVRGDYAKVIEHLKLLVRKKKELGRRNPYIIWQFLVFKHNEHEVEKVRAFGKELGCDVVGVTPAFLPFRPGIKDEWLPEKPEHRYYEPESFPETPPWEWAGQDAQGNKVEEDHAPVPDSPNLRPKEAAVKADETPVKDEAKASPVIDVKVYKEPEKRPLCNWPWAGIAINPNGSVSPCCSIEEDAYDFGDVFKRGFGWIWNGAEYARARKHVKGYVEHKTDVLTRSDHACERCFSVGRANFQFQPWWRFPQYDWWWGINAPAQERRDGDRPGAEAGANQGASK